MKIKLEERKQTNEVNKHQVKGEHLGFNPVNRKLDAQSLYLWTKRV